MPEEQLKVGITGDASGLEQASKDAVSSLDKIDKSATTTAKSLDKLPQVSAKVSQAAKQISSSAAQMGGSVAKGSNQATQSLVNLSRVAQDAPYGFIGIANNINPLLESFQRLKAETGTTGGALKALGSSLMGAGGLGLAVGVASSLLVVFGDKLFGAGKKAQEASNEIKGASDLIAQAGNDYKDAVVQVSRLKDEIDLAKKGFIDKKTVVNEYNQTIGETIGKVKTLDEVEKAIADKGDAYIKFTLLKAAANKALEKSADLALKATEKQNELVKPIDTNSPLFKGLNKGVNPEDAARFQQGIGKAFDGVNKKIQTEVKKANNESERFQDIAKDFFKQAAELSSKFNFKFDGGKFDDKSAGKEKDKLKKSNKDIEDLLEEKKKILLEFVRDFEAIKIPFPELSMSLEKFDAKGLTDELRDKLNKALISIAPIKLKVPTEVQAVDPKKITIPLKPTIVWVNTNLNEQLEDFGKIGNEIGERLGHGFGDVFQKIFEQSMTDAVMKGLSGKALENFKSGLVAVAEITSQAFNGLGDAFGSLTSALLKGENGMKAFGNSIKNTFAQLAAQLVKTIALAAVLSLLTGGIGAKGGLSFLGAFKKILGFNKGGPVPGQGSGDTVPAMLTPGEFVLPKRFAKFGPMIMQMASAGIKMPSFKDDRFHFAQGGFVPNIERSNPVQTIKNIIQPARQEFPAYLPVIDLSYDRLRVAYRRADKQKQLFG